MGAPDLCPLASRSFAGTARAADRSSRSELLSEDYTHDVFLSYSSKDKATVRTVAERLRHDGLRVWFDDWEIKPGDNIPAKVEEGLEHSRVLVLCVSENALGSDWTQLEAGTFRFRDPLNRERRFVPLRLDDAPIKTSLAQYLHIGWRSADREQEYPKLLEACRPRGEREATDWHDPPRATYSSDATIRSLAKDLEDARPEVRAAAAHRLGELGEAATSAVPMLISLLSNEPPAYKRAVGTALGRIGALALPDLFDILPKADGHTFFEIVQTVKFMGHAVEPFVLEYLHDPRPVVRNRSAVLAGKIATDRAIDPLSSALRDEVADVRLSAARALGEMGRFARNAIPPLVGSLQDADPRVRSAAAGAIGEIGPGQAVPSLVACLRDETATVRAAAVRSLGELGQGAKDAIAELILRLDDNDRDVREATVLALGKIGPAAADAVPALQRALEDEFWGVHQNAPTALGQIGIQSLPALIEALSHRDYHIRGRAAAALGSLGPAARGAVCALIESSKDRNPYVVAEVLEALGEIRERTPAVGKAIAHCIGSRDHRVKIAAIWAAGRAGLTAAVGKLLEATHDPDAWTRGSAVRAIGRIGASEAKSRLTALLEDADERVRESARQALAETQRD